MSLPPQLQIQRIAPLSTVQDAGRAPWREIGVPSGGPLDDWSCQVANALVGNPLATAALEIGYGRSQLQFDAAALIAITGARAPIRADDGPLPSWRPLALAAGTRLQIGPAMQGERIYLAVAGGIAGPKLLGSQAGSAHSDLGAGLLQRGDSLPLAPQDDALLNHLLRSKRCWVAPWWANGEPLVDLEGKAALRLLPGAHSPLLTDRLALLRQQWTLSPQANRMAAPLLGTALEITNADRLLSEPVVPGTVQLPPDGQPVVLLAEAQTVGGYARIGHIASVDLARLAQRRPNAAIRFEPISVAAARNLWQWRSHQLQRLRIAANARLDRLRSAAGLERLS